MKMSLNYGAVEQKIVGSKKENASIYIGNYLHEYRSIGRKENGWEKRKKLNAGELVKISKGGTLFENFVLSNIDKLESANYKRIRSFITSVRKKYIDKTDYDKIRVILKGFMSRHINYSDTKNNRMKKSILRENDGDLTDYVNDFALMVIYAKEMCFDNLVYYKELQNTIDEKQKMKIRNFYVQLQNSEGIDVEKIVFKCNDTDNLEINSPMLIKMMLYDFAERYFTSIERLDMDNWENEIWYFFEEKTKGGRSKELNTPYFKAIENVYLDFVDKFVFTEKASNRDKYLLLGRLFSIVGLEKYDEMSEEHENYIDEADYYHKKFTKRSKK